MLFLLLLLLMSLISQPASIWYARFFFYFFFYSKILKDFRNKISSTNTRIFIIFLILLIRLHDSSRLLLSLSLFFTFSPSPCYINNTSDNTNNKLHSLTWRSDLCPSINSHSHFISSIYSFVQIFIVYWSVLHITKVI